MICFTARELEILLSGILPHSALALYVWLRSRMTWQNGRVGDHPKARINWQAIIESLYVDPLPGPSNTGAVTYESARGIARHLVRAGLVRMLSDSARRHLIFECVHAPRSPLPKNQPHSEKHPYPHSEKRGGTQRETGGRGSAQPHSEKRAYPHRHLDFVCTGVHQDARAKNSTVDKFAALAFPPQLTTQQNRELRSLLSNSNVNGATQIFLDEIRASYERQPVCRNPIALARSLIVADKRGEFRPSNAALKIALARAPTHRSNAAEQQGERRPAGRSSKAAAQRALAQLRAGLATRKALD